MTMVHELEHLHHLDERAKTDHMIIFISCEYSTLWTRIHVVDFVAYKHDGFQAFGYDDSQLQAHLMSMQYGDGNSDCLSVSRLLGTIQVC